MSYVDQHLPIMSPHSLRCAVEVADPEAAYDTTAASGVLFATVNR